MRCTKKLFSRNILAQLVYLNWSSIKIFKWKFYFIVRGTHKKKLYYSGTRRFYRLDKQNVPVQHGNRLFTRNILAQLFNLNWRWIKSFKWKLYFIVRATHTRLFTINMLTKQFYPDWSWIKSFRCKLYFFVKATHRKIALCWDKKVWKTGKVKSPGATRNQSFFKKHISPTILPNLKLN